MSYNVTWPYLSPLSTKSVVQHFDEDVFNVSPTSHLYRFITALIGENGAGDLVRQSLIARANQDIQTMWFEDLDVLFSNILGFQRLPEEVYDFTPSKDILTIDKLFEVMVKDAWYRARVTDLLSGLQLGGTTEGMRLITRAVTSVDADVYESWRYRNREGVESVGRSAPHSDREIIIVPHKAEMTERERKVLLGVADRLKPADSIVTVDTRGLSVHSVLNSRSVASDSSYFEVRKNVTNNLDMDSIPPPEYLADELYEGEKWLYEMSQGETSEAPESPFSTTQEYSQYYSVSDKSESQITSAQYLTLYDGVYFEEQNYTVSSDEDKTSEWIDFPLADSPDNFPGGKHGRTPFEEPALTMSGQPYIFEFKSQRELIEEMRQELEQFGADIKNGRYRIPLVKNKTLQVYQPTGTIASNPPKPGSIKASWFTNRYQPFTERI